MRSLTLALAVLLMLGAAAPALARPDATLAATYQATVPATIGAGSTTSIPVTITNIGDEAWLSAGPNVVNLSYHWENAQGGILVWEGRRTPLGPPMAPGETRLINASVVAPDKGGGYRLRFHLVKEGVAWFPQASQPYPVQAQTAYAVRFGSVPIFTFVAGGSYSIDVPATNMGLAPWNAAAPNPVSLSYHWHDAQGNTMVWDGVRTPLAADVVPGATTVITARVTAPPQPVEGGVTLTFDLVREGVNWFEFLGGAPVRLRTTVEAARWSGRYDVPATSSAVIGETKQLAITVTNTGNVPWSASGGDRVNIGYHLFDSAGRTVLWDGTRTPLGSDLAPGQSRALALTFTAPATIGGYSLNVEAVREGVSWFSGYGVPAAASALTVTSGFSAGYGATTTPALATIGATLQLSVDVMNFGPRTLVAGGPTPIALSYHILGAGGTIVTWEGRRGVLPRDIAAGETVTVPINVTLPSTVGDYAVSWDLVQEGVAWFSQLNIPRKTEPVSVQPGVTFYGKGFGHGVGMSQWGAQGWATGASGPPLSGEQIVAKYYSGSTVSRLSPPGNGIRVLLSAPSSAGRFNCSGTQFFNGSLANVVSNGGYNILDEGQGNKVIANASATVTFQFFATAGIVRVYNQATNPPTTVYEGPGPVVTVPVDPAVATTIKEKGVYRGNFRFTNSGGALRTINFLNYDDYVRGVVPLEMPGGWHIQAYRAQALAARSYAFTSYRGTAADYDVTDDQSDQCYGGVQLNNGRPVESDITNLAVTTTAGLVIAFNNQPVRAYFASSSGGYTLAYGCWNATGTTCASSPSYLSAVADPADLLVSVPGPNRQASWTATYTSPEIRNAIAGYRGVDIGTLTSVDLSNQVPAGVGHVISIRFTGTNASVEVPADGFLRGYLGLKSTMVRLSAF
ncbi:MAG: SpoIID/LytB domain-containing protein [Chloroflexi bacterium]|nr:SpoIID/LytB domain-containing protein [Chloroflexota bacterium]